MLCGARMIYNVLLVGLLGVANVSGLLPSLPSSLLPTTTIRTASMLTAERRRNPSRDEEEEDSTKESKEIPQLPSFGSSSFDKTAAAQRKFSGQTEFTPAFVGRKFELQYTCKICETRNVHKVSRIAYHKGVVITVCKGCMSQHVISDNLGFTQQLDGNIEDYFKGKGEGDSVTRVSEDVFNLEKVLGLDTKSGSIFGSDGTTHME